MATITYLKGDATQPQAAGNWIIAHIETDQEFSAILDHLESTTGFGFFLVSIPKSDSRTSPSSSSSSRTRRESRSASLF